MPTPSSIFALGCCLSWLDGNPWTTISDKLQGSLTLGTYQSFNSAAQESSKTRFDTTLDLEFDGDISERWRYHLAPRVFINNMGWSKGVVDQEPVTQDDRFILDAQEGYVRYTADSFDLTVGRQIYRSSVADIVYNPSDNNYPMDFKDLLLIQKMGVFSSALRYSGEDISVTAIAIPWFTPSRLPGNNSRWQGDLGEAPTTFQGFDLGLGSRDLPNRDPGNAGAYELRLASSTLLSGWDLGLYFHDGLDPTGVLRGEILAQQVVLHQSFPRFRESGASFSTTWRNMEFHGEAGYHDTVNNAMDDDYFEYVVGTNLTYYSVPFTEETFIVMEYAGERVVEQKTAGSLYSGSGDYARPFQGGTWIASVNFKFDEDTNLKVSGLLNQRHADGLWRADLGHKFNDVLKVNIGFDVIYGDSDTFFGRWRNNDRFFVTWTIFI